MTILGVLAMCGFIAVIPLAIEAGYRLGRRRHLRIPENLQAVSAMEASVVGLTGLLIAFIFYGAGARFDIRRNLIVQEANAIGTAYLRLDLLPPDTQPQIRQDFRAYLGSRLSVYQQIPDVDAVKAALERSSVLQKDIWKKAIEATKTIGPAGQSLVLGSLNEMIDITTARTVALMTHPPAAVFVLVALAVLVSSVLAGYTMSFSGIRDFAFIAMFSVMVGASVYVIADYEYPRIGLVRIDSVDQLLAEMLDRME
jgi:hypothetical protein